MRFVVQRVSHASVTVCGEVTGKIEKGLLVLIGIAKGDTYEDADRLVSKLLRIRIFEDGSGKTNLSLADVGGGLLLVSQFTLYADCRKGNRPSFDAAAGAAQAEELYDHIVLKCRENMENVETGRFGADMKVELLNDGPFTVIME